MRSRAKSNERARDHLWRRPRPRRSRIDERQGGAADRQGRRDRAFPQTRPPRQCPHVGRGNACARRDRGSAGISGHDRDRAAKTPPTTTRCGHFTTNACSGCCAHVRPAATSRCCARAIRSSMARSCICTAASTAARPSWWCPAFPACPAAGPRAACPITFGDDVLTVVPATLDEASLRERLQIDRRACGDEARP